MRDQKRESTYLGVAYRFNDASLPFRIPGFEIDTRTVLILEKRVMKNTYACPHCDTVLNPSVKVLLVARCQKKKGMILLSPQPGNFKFICDGELEKSLDPGDLITFSCPVCSTELTSTRDDQYTELSLLTPGRESRRIEFSRQFGKQATFIVDGVDVTTFGRDVDESSVKNFFGF